MKSLYLLIDGLTILFPFLLSFDKKVSFYTNWKFVFVAIIAIGLPFVLWDIGFTAMGVWGFNPNYLTGINIGNLPLEEVLFFLVVPYSCTFIYACVKAYFPTVKLKGFNQIFYALLAIYCIALLIFGWGGWYSMAASSLALISIPLLRQLKINLTYLPLSFVIALIPFCIVNGVLTGTGIENEIVWYNNVENSGKRFFTIPIEDVVYAWTLLAGNIVIFQLLYERKIKKQKK